MDTLKCHPMEMPMLSAMYPPIMMGAWSRSFSKLMHMPLGPDQWPIVKLALNANVRNCEHNVPAFNLSLHTAFNK